MVCPGPVFSEALLHAFTGKEGEVSHKWGNKAHIGFFLARQDKSSESYCHTPAFTWMSACATLATTSEPV